MGKLIVIEGLDGSGKSTQFEILGEKLKNMGVNCKSVSFPQYEEESSALVRMYLSGQFGTTPGSVNGYASSLFYAVDRYAGFKRSWGEFYENGGTVLAARYTTSNIIHQCSKLPEEEWDSFIGWLYETEYNKMGIPKPDLVVFLDMPPEVSQKLLSSRYGGDESRKDIHEADLNYINACRKTAYYAVKHYGWVSIECSKNGEPLSIEEISGRIMEEVLKVIEVK